ncbi:OmpA family protein [Halomonas organivorans]|uniref:Outer membrane protein OmpA-like peptidoglycan-associated protein n=1 Tax=Halomonas organivorans TaxID=257772 RepID=A0A7W5BV99_9GAMM|nr:OmpA family protein [Halomonas organivorans]MBB3139328.1 outer membrane protein OmpA-like peptidoglycan-associated protein [Halomonas organivorans]
MGTMDRNVKERSVMLIAGSFLAASSIVGSVYAEEFPDVVVDASHSELGEPFLRNGAEIPIRDLQELGAGLGRLSQEDVISLLGSPVDPSVVGQDDSWLYNVSLPLPGENYLVCQYRISFSQQVLSSLEWRRPQCEHLFSELSMPAQPQKVSLSDDFLFGFDNYSLSPQGRSELRRVLQDAQGKFQALSISVTGHTDRIGAAEYNMHLSEERAKAVADALMQWGVNPGSISYEGRGESEPVVNCPNIAGAELKKCLAPNRRVEILLKERS